MEKYLSPGFFPPCIYQVSVGIFDPGSLVPWDFPIRSGHYSLENQHQQASLVKSVKMGEQQGVKTNKQFSVRLWLCELIVWIVQTFLGIQWLVAWKISGTDINAAHPAGYILSSHKHRRQTISVPPSISPGHPEFYWLNCSLNLQWWKKVSRHRYTFTYLPVIFFLHKLLNLLQCFVIKPFCWFCWIKAQCL